MKSNNYTRKQHDGPIARDNPHGAGAIPGSATTSTEAATTTIDEDDESADALEAPLFRSVTLQPHYFESAVAPFKGATDFKNKFGGFGHAHRKINQTAIKESQQRACSPTKGKAAASPANDVTLREWKAIACDSVYVLPCYYPRCEKRSAITNQSVENLLERLFLCFKKLNIYAQHDNSFATFGFVLRTAEHLELSLLIWYADKSRVSIYVEVDKRQAGAGCGGAFPLQYICRILKAVKCSNQELESDCFCLPRHQELQNGNEGMAERSRKMELLVSTCRCQPEKLLAGACCCQPEENQPAPSGQTKKRDTGSTSLYGVEDQALSSLQMVWGLMRAPVTWSHGLELLSAISDPDKSGVESSLVVSKAILLGESPLAYGESCCRDIHEKVVGLMQSLVGNAEEEKTEHLSAYQKDCMLQLVLSCLVNAMEVHARFSTDTSMDVCVEMPGTAGASVMSQFLESTKGVVACDILETLMTIVRRANTKPHHAYLSVKALFLLSKQNPTIRRYVSLAMASDDDDKTKTNKTRRCAVLQRARDIGTQSHSLLEAECERLQRVLERR